jgi:four helix bundle protein
MRGEKVRRFEDLIVWQKAKDLALLIYRVTGRPVFDRDLGLRNQMRDAAVSVMSNTAEGFERYSRREFRQYLSIARGSAAEVRSQFHVARGLDYITEAEFEDLRGRCIEVSQLLGALRSSLGKADTQ